MDCISEHAQSSCKLKRVGDKWKKERNIDVHVRKEYIIYSGVSAISALHPSIEALGFASGCYLGVQV